MQKCDPRVIARCPDSKTCGDHVFTDGSDCEQFNQKVLAKKPTHGDRIRSMGDKELAKFMQKPFCDKRTDEECKISYCGVCDQCILDWLRQPAEEATR